MKKNMIEKIKSKITYIYIAFIALTYLISPDTLPMGIWDVWETRGKTPIDWMDVIWPWLLWGFCLSLIFRIFFVKDTLGDALSRAIFPTTRYDVFVALFKTHLKAAIVEEIKYRWIIFLGTAGAVSALPLIPRSGHLS